MSLSEVPTSLNCGNVFFDNAPADTESYTLSQHDALPRDCRPEGLVNVMLQNCTPERSSVAEKCTVRVAGPVVVSTLGAKLSAVNTGGVTSCCRPNTDS